MTAHDKPSALTRRKLVAGGAAVAASLFADRATWALEAASTGPSKKPEAPDTTGVGPAGFLRDRLGMEMRPATQAVAPFELEAMRQLYLLGYAKRFGRWTVFSADEPDKSVGTLIGSQFGKGPVPGAPGDQANTIDTYESYDLSEPTVTAFVTTETDDEHAAILRHRHWDSLHVFAPIAPKAELAKMLLPVRAKQPVQSWERGRLFERGVVEYFSALGEVNIQAERAFRRLRLKNVHGQSIYDKHNA